MQKKDFISNLNLFIINDVPLWLLYEYILKKNEFKNITQKKEYFYISVKKVHIQTSPGNLEVRHLAK